MYRLILTLLLLIFSEMALAYIGPGAGLSVLGSVLGILATIGLAILAIILWPVRKLMKKRKAARAAAAAGEAGTEETVNKDDSA